VFFGKKEKEQKKIPEKRENYYLVRRKVSRHPAKQRKKIEENKLTEGSLGSLCVVGGGGRSERGEGLAPGGGGPQSCGFQKRKEYKIRLKRSQVADRHRFAQGRLVATTKGRFDSRG